MRLDPIKSDVARQFTHVAAAVALIVGLSACSANTASELVGSPGSGADPSAEPIVASETTSEALVEPGQSAAADVAWVQVSAGNRFACGITKDGAAYCWGDNRSGELGIRGTGNADISNSPVPVAVNGLDAEVTSISLGWDLACAVTTTGGAYCWGRSVVGSSAPEAVPGLESGVVSISTGGEHSCAVTESGDAFCWGPNSFGQLGNEAISDAYSDPMLVSALESQVASISAGMVHTCAVTLDGAVYCWGSAAGEPISSTLRGDSPLPVLVLGLPDAASVSAGVSHTCAVTTAGGVYCWGDNRYGQLGDGTTENANEPVAVLGMESGVASISGHGDQTCALKTDATVWCWGTVGGGVSDPENHVPVTTPTQVPIADGSVTSLSSGQVHSCAATDAGTAFCWGYNDFGQLGNNTMLVATDTPNPVRVAAPAVPVPLGQSNMCDYVSLEDKSLIYGSSTDAFEGPEVIPGVDVLLPGSDEVQSCNYASPDGEGEIRVTVARFSSGDAANAAMKASPLLSGEAHNMAFGLPGIGDYCDVTFASGTFVVSVNGGPIAEGACADEDRAEVEANIISRLP